MGGNSYLVTYHHASSDGSCCPYLGGYSFFLPAFLSQQCYIISRATTQTHLHFPLIKVVWRLLFSCSITPNPSMSFKVGVGHIGEKKFTSIRVELRFWDGVILRISQNRVKPSHPIGRATSA